MTENLHNAIRIAEDVADNFLNPQEFLGGEYKDEDFFTSRYGLNLLGNNRITDYKRIVSLHKEHRQQDSVTADHELRVARICHSISTQMQLRNKEKEILSLAALVHDIGKYDLPQPTLHKEGTLSPTEYFVIKTHPFVGYVTLKLAGISPEIAKLASSHHERLNGSGYGYLLERPKTEKISLPVRILAVADCLDAMVFRDKTFKHVFDALDQLSIENMDSLDRDEGFLYDDDVILASRDAFLQSNFFKIQN